MMLHKPDSPRDQDQQWRWRWGEMVGYCLAHKIWRGPFESACRVFSDDGSSLSKFC